jgi:CheY-like chemotaxis protein
VQESLRRELVETIRVRLGEARQALHDWVKSNEGAESEHLKKLYTASHSLANAGLAGFSRLAHLSGALEAMLKELLANPKKFNVSSIRTITQAVELTPALFRNSEAPQQEVFASPMIMLVDDEAISRETISAALEKAHLRALRLDDPTIALKLVEENRFDLVFLDIDMPGISGFKLCEKIHATEANLTTPVVFVTALSDFETRSHSSESGAVDFLAKPVWLNELALKSIFHLLRGRILAAI